MPPSWATRLCTSKNDRKAISQFGRCSLALWRPVIEQTIDPFGPARCQFGCNFPIEKLWTTCEALLEVMRNCLASHSESERQTIFYDTAARLYRV